MSTQEGMSAKEEKYRAKYKIPDTEFVAIGVGGYAAFDGDFVTIQHVGLARGVVGKGVKRIPLSSVTAVQIKPAGALVNGFIQFTIPGGNERRSAFGSQTRDAASDENSVVFARADEAAFLRLRELIEAAMLQGSQRGAGAVPEAAQPDVIAQLVQLGQLRDAGVVTEEEFTAKKTEMLGRL